MRIIDKLFGTSKIVNDLKSQIKQLQKNDDDSKCGGLKIMTVDPSKTLLIQMKLDSKQFTVSGSLYITTTPTYNTSSINVLTYNSSSDAVEYSTINDLTFT